MMERKDKLEIGVSWVYVRNEQDKEWWIDTYDPSKGYDHIVPAERFCQTDPDWLNGTQYDFGLLGHRFALRRADIGADEWQGLPDGTPVMVRNDGYWILETMGDHLRWWKGDRSGWEHIFPVRWFNFNDADGNVYDSGSDYGVDGDAVPKRFKEGGAA